VVQKQRRNAVITAILLAAMAIGIYAVVVLKYMVR
jgi:hypothetical protein